MTKTKTIRKTKPVLQSTVHTSTEDTITSCSGEHTLFTFETFHQSHEEAWPDQLKDNNKGEDKDKGKDKDKCRDKVFFTILSREIPE